MNDNPYQPPLIHEAAVLPTDRGLSCPICGSEMETGFIASSASLYWRQWLNQKWLLRGNETLSKTGSVFGINKLSGFRCQDCEVVLFAYGNSRKRFSPDSEK